MPRRTPRVPDVRFRMRQAGSATALRNGAAAFPEHSMVALSTGMRLDDGRTLPAGARGAVVAIWADGEAYEVEFAAPFHAVATIPGSDLREDRPT